MNLGTTCAECGSDDAGPRQLCPRCEQLYPLSEPEIVRPFVDDVDPAAREGNAP